MIIRKIPLETSHLAPVPRILEILPKTFPMNKRHFPLLAILALLFLAGCTAGPNELVNSPPADGEVAGFLMGLWQGLIAPVTFFLSLFFDHITIYEVHNNGAWYDFGFVLGTGILFGGGSRGAGRLKGKKATG